jgi:predicted nucleic acid-binding Zn ribbon protein
MLKRDRFFNRGDSEVSFYLNEVAEAGIVLIYPTGAVGQPGLDTDVNTATVPTGTTGQPCGVLMQDVVNKDLTTCPLMQSKMETQVGSKVEVLKGGWILTDMIHTGSSPAPGNAAHFTAGGLFTTTTSSVRVGTFESAKVNGFARIRIQLY